MEEQAIKAFLAQYYRDYNQLGQSKETLDELDQYWDSDIKVISYTPGPDGKYPQVCANRQQWKRFLGIVHSFFDEILEPQSYIVDAAQNTVAVRLQIVNRRKGSPQVISQTDGMAVYQLQDAAGKPRISQLEIYFGDARALRKPFRGLPKTLRFIKMLRTTP